MGKNRKQASLTNVVQYDSNFNLSIGSSASSSFNSSGSIIAASGFTGSLSGSVFGLGNTVSFSSSVSSDLVNLESKSASVDISITNINSFTASNGNQSLNQLTGSLATTGSNTFYGTQVFSGSVFIATDLIVQGSSSIQYISASSVSIGTNIVNLNTATPSVRYAGISVQDSGSSAGITGSMLWDSLCNRWIYSNPSTIGYSGGLLMSGPRAATLGSETTLTCNYIAKSGGGDHLYDSCIIDDGTTVCVNANLKGSGQICSLMGNFSCIGVGINTPITTLHISNSGNNFLTLERSTATNSKQLNINIESNSQTTISYDCVGGFVIGSSCNPNTQTGFNERLRISGNGIACFSCQVCAPSFIGGTMSGTTIYGSTAVCSAVGLFSGCVGIGTISPITRLQVIANTPTFLYSPGQLDVRTQESQAANKGAMISIGGNAIGNNTPYNFGIIGAYKTNSTSEDYSSYMIFGTSDVYSNVFERMRITTGGNVGIGTCTPVGKLDINTGGNRNIVISNDSTDTEYNIISLNGTRTKGSYAGIAGGGTADNNLYLNSCVGVVIQTGASFTERMRITGGGNLLATGGRISNARCSGGWQEWVAKGLTLTNNSALALFCINGQYDNLIVELAAWVDQGAWSAVSYKYNVGYNAGSSYTAILGPASSICGITAGTGYNETWCWKNCSGSNINNSAISLRIFGMNTQNSVSNGGADLIISNYLTRIS